MYMYTCTMYIHVHVHVLISLHVYSTLAKEVYKYVGRQPCNPGNQGHVLYIQCTCIYLYVHGYEYYGINIYVSR